jgi:hypothetical protein
MTIVPASACHGKNPVVPGDTLCEIDGVQYSEGAIEPTNQAQCCRPDLSKTSWSPWFQDPVSYRSVLGATYLAAAAFQGNGLLDLVVVSPTDSLAILRQLGGDAGFVDLGPEDIRANVVLIDDVSGDGYPDVVTLTTGGPQTNPCATDLLHCRGVGVSLGDPSTGDLTAPVRYLPDEPIVSGVLADFDGDHKPDLAVGVTSRTDAGGWVRILWNQGGGTFQEDPTVWFPVGSLPQGLTAVDLNDSGFPDLVVANTVEHTIAVLLNQHTRADGGFLAAATLPSGSTPWAVAAGNFRSAAALDVVTANGDGTISFWRDDGGVLGDLVQTSVGDSPYAMATADFDGDGNTDLAILSFDPGTVTVLRPNLTVPRIKLQTGQHAGASIVAADFNHDGRIDLATCDFNYAFESTTVHVFMANCGPNSAPP